jgi:hypothetical protein
MLREALVPALKARFAGRPLVLGAGEGPVATFPAAHPGVGDLVIVDDGDELTIYIGDLTHRHFDNYDEGLEESERARRIVEEVVAFLDDLFADRIEFFGSRFGGGGCRRRSETPRGIMSKLFLGARTYVWSGPIDDSSSGVPSA